MTDSESIKGSFPFPIFPRHPGIPHYQIVNEVHTKGKSNAASIATELGGEHTDSLASPYPQQRICNLRGTILYDLQILVLFHSI